MWTGIPCPFSCGATDKWATPELFAPSVKRKIAATRVPTSRLTASRSVEPMAVCFPTGGLLGSSGSSRRPLRNNHDMDLRPSPRPLLTSIPCFIVLSAYS